MGSIRSPFCGDCRSRPAGRAGAGSANGLPAGDDLDPRGRSAGRGGAGLYGAVRLYPTRRAFAWRAGQGGDGAHRWGTGAGGLFYDHGDYSRGTGDDRRESADPQSVGNLHRGVHHPAGDLHGDLSALSAPGPHW